MITITNIRNVSVKGSPVGALVNAFQESGDPVAVQLALEAYCDALISSLAAKDAKILEITEAKDAEIAEITKAKDAEIEELKASKDTQISDLLDFRSRAQAGIEQVVAVIQNPEIDPETTMQNILAVIAEGTAPEAEREKARIRQQIAELKAKLGE